jgi:hypothetical protein
MLARSAIRAIRRSPFGYVRAFSEGKKPPKGFEKFYKKKQSDKKRTAEDKQTLDKEPEASEHETPKTTTQFADGTESEGFKWKFDFNFGGGRNPFFWWLLPSMIAGGIGFSVYNQFAESDVPEVTF